MQKVLFYEKKMLEIFAAPQETAFDRTIREKTLKRVPWSAKVSWQDRAAKELLASYKV